MAMLAPKNRRRAKSKPKPRAAVSKRQKEKEAEKKREQRAHRIMIASVVVLGILAITFAIIVATMN